MLEGKELLPGQNPEQSHPGQEVWWEGGSTKTDQRLLQGSRLGHVPPMARLAPAPWADFFRIHPEIPVGAAEVPGISQDGLAELTAPPASALPMPSGFSAASAPSKAVAQFLLISCWKDFFGLLEGKKDRLESKKV